MRGRRILATAAVLVTIATACGDDSSAPAARDTAPAPNETSGDAPPPAPPEVASLLADEPVVPAHEDEKFTNPGATLRHDGRWWMLRNSFTVYGQESRTDLLVSDDLTTWTEVTDANPLWTTADLAFTDGSAFAMSAVVDDDGTWVAYLYDFTNARDHGAIHRATAPGAEGPWSFDPEPVLSPGPDGSWDHLRVGEPQVLRHDGRWMMWFTGYRDAPASDAAAIGLATSDDGVTWTKHDGPVLTGDQGWTKGSIADARVVHDGTGFVMVYRTRRRGAFGNGLAFSEDGRSWTSWAGNPIIVEDDIPNGRGFWQSALVADGDAVTYLLESGGGGGGTTVFPWAIDVATARSADVARIETDVSVDGDTVTIDVAVDGIDLRFAPGEGGANAHPHAFVDRVPTAPGNTVPLGVDSVVHARGATLRITGLEPGEHRITIVLADDEELALDYPAPVLVDVTTP